MLTASKSDTLSGLAAAIPRGPYYCVCYTARWCGTPDPTAPVQKPGGGWMCDFCKGDMPNYNPGERWPIPIPEGNQ